MNLLFVDQHILFREGVASLLSKQSDFEEIFEAGTAAEALEISSAFKPDMILMETNLPDRSGLKIAEEILNRLPETKIVFLTQDESKDQLIEAIRIGAKGYLKKTIPAARLFSALRGVAHGEAAISRRLTFSVLEEFYRLSNKYPVDDDQPDLTPREVEVYQLLAKGANNREIADKLFISESTVKIHVRNILGKMNLQNRRQAVRVPGTISSYSFHYNR